MTNFSIVEQLYHQTFSRLMELQGKATDDLVWDQMKYQLEWIPVTCEELLDRKTYEVKFELSELTKTVLEDLANELKSSGPHTIILGYSYSNQSNISSYILDCFNRLDKSQAGNLPGVVHVRFYHAFIQVSTFIIFISHYLQIPYTSSFGKFHSMNGSFITSLDEINAKELQDYMIQRLKQKQFPARTKFYLIGGIHHRIDRYGKVSLAATRYAFLQGFYYKGAVHL